MAVFAGKRIRDNNVFGTVTNNPLTNVGTTLNSAGLANLSAVSGDHAVLVLDPLRLAGAPEIVIVTAHTGGASSATVTRGAYGTTARQHAAGTLWVLAATMDDLIRIVTSSTRPADTYAGQFIFEQDTKKLVGFGGTDWAPRDAGGQIGYAAVTASQTGIGATETDLTGLTIPVTVGTGRRIKVTASLSWDMDTTAAVGQIRIRQDGTEVQYLPVYAAAAGQSQVAHRSVVLSPTAGAHTYKLTGQRTSASGTLAIRAFGTDPSFILVEDIGAA